MRLRYRDLVARGIVNNRTTLSNWIKGKGLKPDQKPFPLGQLTGPNTRTWDEETEVNPWLETRPTKPKPAPKVKGRVGRPRKNESQAQA